MLLLLISFSVLKMVQFCAPLGKLIRNAFQSEKITVGYEQDFVSQKQIKF